MSEKYEQLPALGHDSVLVHVLYNRALICSMAVEQEASFSQYDIYELDEVRSIDLAARDTTCH